MFWNARQVKSFSKRFFISLNLICMESQEAFPHRYDEPPLYWIYFSMKILKAWRVTVTVTWFSVLQTVTTGKGKIAAFDLIWRTDKCLIIRETPDPFDYFPSEFTSNTFIQISILTWHKGRHDSFVIMWYVSTVNKEIYLILPWPTDTGPVLNAKTWRYPGDKRWQF